jgi:hypothetical protein
MKKHFGKYLKMKFAQSTRCVADGLKLLHPLSYKLSKPLYM